MSLTGLINLMLVSKRSLLYTRRFLQVAVFLLSALASPLFADTASSDFSVFQESKQALIKTFIAKDGKSLAYRSYRATPASRNGISLIYLHGIESHGGWFDKAALEFTHRGYDVFSLDRRGSGLNRENRGFIVGHVDDYQQLFDDITAFIEQRQFEQPPFFIGLSWGGKLALAYGLSFPQQMPGLILITPGLVPRVDVGFFTKIKILTASWFFPTRQFSLPIKDEMFTTTPRYLHFIQQDPLRNQTASAAFLMQSRKLGGFIDKHISNNQLPTLLLLAGQDVIIDNKQVESLLRRGDRQRLTVVNFADQTHSIQLEAAARMVSVVDNWINAVISRGD